MHIQTGLVFLLLHMQTDSSTICVFPLLLIRVGVLLTPAECIVMNLIPGLDVDYLYIQSMVLAVRNKCLSMMESKYCRVLVVLNQRVGT